MNNNFQVIFSYTQCDKSYFAHEVNFDEDLFRKEVNKIFETSIPVKKVELEFILEDKEASRRFTVVIRIESPLIQFTHTENAFNNYSASVYQAIRKGLEFVRQEKEKMTR